MTGPGATPPPDRSSPACLEWDRVWLEGTHDPLVRARVEGHLGRCPRCQTASTRLQTLAEAVSAAAPPLDDMTRARLLARMTPHLDALAASQGPRLPLALRLRRGLLQGRRPRLVGGAALAVAVAALLAVGLPRLQRGSSPEAPVAAESAPSPARTAASTPSTTDLPVEAAAAPAHRRAPSPAPAPSTVASPAPRDPLALLVTGAGHATSRLQVSTGRTLRARLADRARLALHGPATLQVMSRADDTIELRLTSGALVMDYDRRRGGRLRIQSPGAVTDVIGTLFSVEVSGPRSRVAVARGQVSVAADDDVPRVVDAGQAILSGSPAPGPVPPPTRKLLAAYQREAAAAQPPPPAAPARALALAAPAPVPAPALAPATAAPAAAAPPGVPTPATATAPATAPTPAPALEPAPVPVPATPASSLPPEPAARYRLAEAAMKRGAWDEARGHLEAVAASRGDPRTVAAARYELAQIALRDADRARALHWLDALAGAPRDPALEEPATLLRCEVTLASGDTPAARRCLRAFRVAFPGSSSDALALGLLLRLTPAQELCTGARPLLDEFLQRYPGHRLAAELLRRKGTCAP